MAVTSFPALLTVIQYSYASSCGTFCYKQYALQADSAFTSTDNLSVKAVHFGLLIVVQHIAGVEARGCFDITAHDG